MVVGEVADDRPAARFGLREVDELGPGADERVPAEAAALDGLEEEAAATVLPQSEVRPEWGEEVGGYRVERCHRTKKASREALCEAGCRCALAQAPASRPAPPPALERYGSHRAERSAVPAGIASAVPGGVSRTTADTG